MQACTYNTRYVGDTETLLKLWAIVLCWIFWLNSISRYPPLTVTTYLLPFARVPWNVSQSASDETTWRSSSVFLRSS